MKLTLRALVEDYYDIQDVRIRSDNRVRAYKDGVSEQDIVELKELTGNSLHKVETRIKAKIQSQLKEEPLWNEWLLGVKGIGPVLAGGLISWYGDVENFATISKMWRYSGLSVSPEGRAERRTKGEKIHYNPAVKTLCWKVGESFVKTKGGYRDLYSTFRAEYDEKWKTGEDCGSETCKKKGACMDGHRYAAAKRKAVKVFLAHLHMQWRVIKGLEPERPFIIGRDGHEHLIPVIMK